MIPILSDSATLTGNGLGGLSDAIECTVFNEINGEYELRMRYPITGEHYSEMLINYFIFAEPQILASAQPFRIYRITRPLNGVVTVYARHLAYDMSGIVIQPMTAASLTAALTAVPANAVPSPCPFTLASSRAVATQFKLTEPRTMWRALGGEAGSFLDVYGGEWEFNGYTATLKTTLGTNRGVTVRYGKNLTELEQDANIETSYGGVFPYWYDDTDGLVTLSELYVQIAGSPYNRILLLDCGEYFETKPTEAQLRAQANAYITANSVGDMKTSWKVSFALLAQSGEYEAQAILEQVQLGDTVNVVYEALGVNASARVVKTEWDVLGDKYKSVTLGRVKQNLASILVGQNRETENAIAQTKSALEKAIESSTDFIKNGTGYMRFIYNSAGDLVEIVSLDNSDISQAQSVWRWNNGGFGHSSTGYNGAYTTAITQNGAIVADFITTGTLNAARVKAGILSDALNKNSWNLDTGAFTITNGSINITTDSATQDKIVLTYGNYSVSMSPYSIKQIDANTAGANSITLEQGELELTSHSGASIGRYYPTNFTLSQDSWQIALNSINGLWFLNKTDLTNYPYAYSQYGWGTINLHPDNNVAPIINLYPSAADTNGRTSLDNTGLTFRDSSNNVTASYPSYGLYAQDMQSRNLVKVAEGSFVRSGVTFTVGSDGSVSMTGTSSASDNPAIGEVTLKAGHKYYLTGANGGSSSLYLYFYSSTDGTCYDAGSGSSEFTATVDGTYTLRVYISASGVSTGKVFWPMLRESKITDATYYPYAMTNRELTEAISLPTDSSATTNETINATWTKSSKSYTIPEEGWYVVEAYVSYASKPPRGAMITTRTNASSSNVQITAITEMADNSIGGYTITQVRATCAMNIWAGAVIEVYFKSSDSSSNATALLVHRIL